MSGDRRGVLSGAAAYLLWGVFPLYFPLLHPAGAVEVLAHRVLWSLIFVVVLVQLNHGWPAVRAIVADRGRLLRLTGAATVLAVNWGVYIYGVTSDRVVETSLGYFINPLVTVMLGVVVLGERLRAAQYAAVAVAGIAVVFLSLQNGGPPWIALTLAVSFGSYGLLRKTARVGTVEGLAVETAVLAPLALLYLVGLHVAGHGTLLAYGPGHALLLAATGVVTAIPLLFFGAAASRVPLTTLGLLQYVTPTMQFLLGVLAFHESLSSARLIGFCLVWLALLAFSVDLIRQRRGQQRVPQLEPV